MKHIKTFFLLVFILSLPLSSRVSLADSKDESQKLLLDAFQAAVGVGATFETLNLMLTDFSLGQVSKNASDRDQVADLIVLISEAASQGEVVGRLLGMDLYPAVKGQTGDVVFKNAYVAVKKIREAHDRLNKNLETLKSDGEKTDTLVKALMSHDNNQFGQNLKGLETRINNLASLMDRVGQEGLYPR